MITVSFHNGTQTVTSEVYQYDLGQRCRLYGLPSPDEFAQYDDFIPDRTDILLECHYYLREDEQAICYLGQWDDDEHCWVVDAPDELLEQCNPVYMSVYVKFSELIRAKTYYQACFTPIHRASPSDRATQIQIKTWTELQEEIEDELTNIEGAISRSDGQTTLARNATDAANTAADAADTAADAANAAAGRTEAAVTQANDAAQSANTAAQSANTAAQSANTAAQSANTAAQSANTAAQSANDAAAAANAARARINNVYVRSTTTLPPGSDATASVTQDENGIYFSFGIPGLNDVTDDFFVDTEVYYDPDNPRQEVTLTNSFSSKCKNHNYLVFYIIYDGYQYTMPVTLYRAKQAGLCFYIGTNWVTVEYKDDNTVYVEMSPALPMVNVRIEMIKAS